MISAREQRVAAVVSHDVPEDGVVLRPCEDDAAAENGQESHGCELRAHLVVGDHSIVQHSCLAAAPSLTIGKQEDAKTVPPNLVVGHDRRARISA